MSDQKYHWAEIRDTASVTFGGDQPTGTLEQELIDHFLTDPERVIRTTNRIVAAHQRKPFDSPWAVIRADLNKPQTDATVNATTSRQRLIDQARSLVRHAGLYHATWESLAAHLFGDPTQTAPLAYLEQLERDTRNNPGRVYYDPLLKAAIRRTRDHGQDTTAPDTHAPLSVLREDQNARDQLEAEYNRLRPAGIQAELAHEAWNTKTAQARRALNAQASSKPDDPDADLT